MLSHVVDEELLTEEEFCKHVFPKGGVIDEASIFIEDCSPNRLDLQVKIQRADEVTTLYTIPVKRGDNSADGFDVEGGDRLSFSIKTEEAAVRGIWIGLNFKHS